MSDFDLMRLNALGAHYGLCPVAVSGNLHAYLDRLDTCAGIRTARAGLGALSYNPRHWVNEYVGARVLKHELLLEREKRLSAPQPVARRNRFFFWLGREAIKCRHL